MKKIKIITIALAICCILYVDIMLGEIQTPNKYLNQINSDSDIKKINNSTYHAYLNQFGKRPVEYVLDKFKYHQILIIGEQHHVQQNLELLQELIPKLYKKADVRFLGYEFFASSCQKDIDTLINGKEYDQTLAKHIIRESAIQRGQMWPYQEYVEVFRIVWDLNQSIADHSKRFRIIFMSPNMNWHDFHNGTKEQKRAALLSLLEAEKQHAQPIIEELNRTGHKGLIWCGSTHAVTRLRGKSKNGPKIRLGGHLYDLYKDKVFQIMLHAPWYLRSSNGMDYAFNGVLDKVFNELGKPIGFDIAKSPFADMKLSKDFMWAIDNPGAKFKDYCDGYIYLVSLKMFKGNKVMNIAEIVPDNDAFQKIRSNSHSIAVQKMKSRKEYLTGYKKAEEKFKQYQQTFMPFLSEKK